MLNEVKPVSSFGVWGKQVNTEIRTDSIQPSLSQLSSKDKGGTRIKPKKIETIYPIYRTLPTAFDQDEAYGVADEVFVSTDTVCDYWFDDYFSEPFTVFAGRWLCIKNVPSFKFQEGRIAGQLEALGPAYYRISGINYFPQWPHPTDPEKQYWMLLSLYPKTMKACVDGVTHTYYVQSAESGSAQV